jgi:type III pantothenate kinase
MSQSKPEPATADPWIVADVGNSRIKWGLCAADAVRDSASLPPDDPAAWQKQLQAWGVPKPLAWVVCGVRPERRDRLADWLRQAGHIVRLLTSPQQLPLETAVPQPEKVGIDRLLNAVAVNTRRVPGSPVVIVDAGSAITVDYVDAQGIFRGGAILPGIRLMAQSLHNYTALLPLIDVDGDIQLPGTATIAAMKAGIFCAALGGVKETVRRLAEGVPAGIDILVVFGGGDGALLARDWPGPAKCWPLMTLEGLRLAARNLP